MSSRTIRLEGVSKRFRRGAVETHALDNIDLAIGAGEFVAVVGPSGCGKSTLLRLVAGLIPASAGAVRFDAELVSAPRKDTGIVFQKANLVEWRNALDNVLLQVELRSLSPADYRERAKKLLEALGLGEFLDRHPHELSGGMQQRAAIARALVHSPEVLLMDEPFGALDALTREQVRLDLEALWLRDRMSVMFITHSIDEAVLLADRVVLMTARPGRVDRILPVDLPRPRGLGARKAPEFVRLVDEITREFLARGVLDDHGAQGRLG
ncbi:MAG: ABC transporter ATP-binding protein [Burkholderiales bacterium]|nr:ABC transporter ATP-binding protein [Burkholderiales bacterium]